MRLRDLDAEMWLVRRLGQHGARVFDGLTTTADRRERIRAAILGNGLEMVIAGRGQNGKPETYSSVFERLYGEPLRRREDAA